MLFSFFCFKLVGDSEVMRSYENARISTCSSSERVALDGNEEECLVSSQNVLIPGGLHFHNTLCDCTLQAIQHSSSCLYPKYFVHIFGIFNFHSALWQSSILFGCFCDVGIGRAVYEIIYTRTSLGISVPLKSSGRTFRQTRIIATSSYGVLLRLLTMIKREAVQFF